MKSFEFVVILLFLSFTSVMAQSEKINGVSFVASKDAANDSHVTPIINLNANYAAIMPFGFIRSLEHPNVIYNTDRQWYGETKAGAKHYIKILRARGIQIMLKPQIWVWHGEFTGNIEMNNEKDWETLEDSYSKFILDYANLAQEVNAEIFCIGTELEKFVKNRPNYWQELIGEIRERYNGKLTYAANWDEFKRTPFWKDLDFIGIDAYFPVSESKTPSLAEAISGWDNHKGLIHEVSKTNGKPILFTEYGYRSVDHSGKEPWNSNTSKYNVNLDAQVNCTKALLETFWDEDWFAGGFVWKWFINHKASGGENNDRFTPQNKPVEKVIANHYKLYSK